MAALAAVRVRGHAKIRHDAVETMDMLRLNRVNHCVLLPKNDTTDGMLHVVKDYVTWGEVTPEAIARLLFHKGELVGGGKLTDAYVKENSGFTSILSFAKAVEKGEAKITDLKGLRPVLRLMPPRQGHKTTRRSFADGGALGYRGAEMEKLIGKMLPATKEAK